MDEKNRGQANKTIKVVFVTAALVYAALILAVYTLLGQTMNNNTKIVVISFAPMVICGLILLILKKVKGE